VCDSIQAQHEIECVAGTRDEKQRLTHGTCLLAFHRSLLASLSLSLSLSQYLLVVVVVGSSNPSLDLHMSFSFGYLCEMEDDLPLDNDARIKLSIGSREPGDDDQLSSPVGLAFDIHRGLLLVVDSNNHRVQVFSCDDGSLVSKLGGEEGDQPGQFAYPWGLAIDHDHDRILITDKNKHRIQSWSLSEHKFLSCIGKRGSRDLEFKYARGIAIDKHHHRIIIVDRLNNRLVFLSSIDLSFLFKIGGTKGSQPSEFYCPSSIAIDDDRHRIIVTDTLNHRVQVLSLIDGSFLFEFGSSGNQPCQFSRPQGVCIDNQGRIIVADSNNYRLQSFTHEGHPISSFDCGNEYPLAVAFDEHRGLIAFTAGNQVHVIGANQWLADTKFTWRPDRHRHAPSWMKQTVLTMTMIRSMVDESSAMSMIPNELLFEIFSMIDLSTCPQDQPRLGAPDIASTSSSTSTSRPASSQPSSDIEIGSRSDRTLKSTKRKCFVM